MDTRDKIFISGFPRAGTTMLCLMMTYFDDCDSHCKAEEHPIISASSDLSAYYAQLYNETNENFYKKNI